MTISKSKKLPTYLFSDKFLEFIEKHTSEFMMSDGFGRWIHEYQDMEAKGQFEAEYLRGEYIKILVNQSCLDFQRKQAVYACCIYAHDDIKAFYADNSNFLWKICVITGETATDEDGDEYIELSFDEASQICKALNTEAEENLFLIKRM